MQHLGAWAQPGLKAAALPASYSIKGEFSGATVLITGASGYIGSVVLEQLLRTTDVATVYLLLRARRGQSIQERADKLLQGALFHKVCWAAPASCNVNSVLACIWHAGKDRAGFCACLHACKGCPGQQQCSAPTGVLCRNAVQAYVQQQNNTSIPARLQHACAARHQYYMAAALLDLQQDLDASAQSKFKPAASQISSRLQQQQQGYPTGPPESKILHKTSFPSSSDCQCSKLRIRPTIRPCPSSSPATGPHQQKYRARTTSMPCSNMVNLCQTRAFGHCSAMFSRPDEYQLLLPACMGKVQLFSTTTPGCNVPEQAFIIYSHLPEQQPSPNTIEPPAHSSPVTPQAGTQSRTLPPDVFLTLLPWLCPAASVCAAAGP